MELRFHRGRVDFDPGLILPPRMTQDEAAELFARGDKESRNKIIEGHAWLAADIAARMLHALNLPAHKGEDMTGEGLVVIVEAVSRMKKCPRNISAYLSKTIEKRLSEYLDKDNLCPVPARTKRDRAAKGKPQVEPPKIRLATDFAGDEDEGNESVLSRLRRRPCPFDVTYDFTKPEDLHEYCQDELDRDIIDLRYNGPVPRALVEIAELAGVSRGTVEKRLDRIEARVYRDLERLIPPGERTKGVRLLASRPKKHCAEMAATSA